MVGCPNLGFTIAHIQEPSKSRRGAYGHGGGNATCLDPCLVHGKGMSELADVCGEVPRGIGLLPAFYICLYQQESALQEDNSCLV